MLEHDSSLNHLLGALLFGVIVVGFIFRIIRRSTSEQDPALDSAVHPAVESTDLTLLGSESSSDRLRIQATQRLPGPEQPQSVWQLLIEGYESHIPVPSAY